MANPRSSRVAVAPPTIATVFDAVVTGAGISFDAPSKLPSAAELVNDVWCALQVSLDGLVSEDLRERVRPQLAEMRLEQFLELLSGSGAVPPHVLVLVYDQLGGAAFNENHLRLAALGTIHFTLNMDTLIENAGPGSSVVHLHGTWDRPRSIKTTVTHYSRGLSRSLRNQFGRAITGKEVLVIGYSGRDTDVMPVFHDHPPKNITWVGPDPHTWGPEIRALRSRYDSNGGADSNFTAVDEVASGYLPRLIPDVPLAEDPATRRPRRDLAQDLIELTTRAQRVIALVHLLFDMGLNEDIRRVLNGESFTGAAEIMRRKMIARSWNRDGNTKLALASLLQRPSSLAEVVAWPGNLNEIAAMLRRGSHARAARYIESPIVAVSYLVPTRSMRRRRMLVQIRHAKSLAVRGRTRRAIHIAERVTGSRRTRYIIGESSMVDALTWHADALKDGGQLKAAQRKAEIALQSIPYSDHSQAAYALWKYAEIRLIAGRPEGENTTDFETDINDCLTEALAKAELGRANEALAWFHGTLAERFAGADVGLARDHLNAAIESGAGSPDRGPWGRSYHLLQRAAVELAEDDLRSAVRSASSAKATAADGNVAPVFLQARQLLSELRWRQDPAWPLTDELEALASAYRTRDMLLNEARALLALSSLRGTPFPSVMLSRAHTLGWNEVLRRARGIYGPYPWRWSLLV